MPTCPPPGLDAARPGRPPAAPLLRGYLASLGGQGLQAGLHFALNLTMLRLMAPADYGIFALAFVIAPFAGGLNNALAATPLSVFTTALARGARRKTLESLLVAATQVQAAAALLIVVVVGTALAGRAGLALAVALFVAAWTLRNFVRAFGYARRQPPVVLAGDTLYVGLGSLLVPAAGWVDPRALLVLTLLGLTLAQLLAAAYMLRRLGLTARSWPRLRTLRLYRSLWPHTRWALIGVVTTMLQSEAHSLLVTAFAGPAAYAPLAAGLLLFGPLRLMLTAWQMAMRPELVVALAAGRRAQVVRMLSISALLLGASAATLTGAIALFWPPIARLLYETHYAAQPMARIVACWSLITLVAALATPLSGVLQALRAFRPLAFVTVQGAAVSLTLVALLLALLDPAATLLGVLAAELLALLLLLTITRSRMSPPW